MDQSSLKQVQESEKRNDTCSRCGVFGPLATGNLSRKTGERLFRSWCVSCEKQRKAKWVNENIEHVCTQTLEYQKANPENTRRYKKNWADANKDYQKEYKRFWRKTYPEKARASVSARRKRVKQNTPCWESTKALEEFYLHCPKGYHVDHIIPLKGKFVSGLHTVLNLQYLPAKENMRKRNSYEIDQ